MDGWSSAQPCPSPAWAAGRNAGSRDDFLELTDAVWRARAFGDFWSYCLVAEGAVDIACEPELNALRHGRAGHFVREAGGAFSSLDGEDGPFGGNALATNGLLHEQVLSRPNGHAAVN